MPMTPLSEELKTAIVQSFFRVSEDGGRYKASVWAETALDRLDDKTRVEVDNLLAAHGYAYLLAEATKVIRPLL